MPAPQTTFTTDGTIRRSYRRVIESANIDGIEEYLEGRSRRRLALLPIDFVIEEAQRLGLATVEMQAPKQRKWVLIEGRKCQVVRTRLSKTSPKYPKSLATSIYLPRTSWPDFVIYVVMPPGLEDKPEFYIVPRGALSTDTGWAPDALTSFKNNWHQLLEIQGIKALARRFKFLTPPLQSVVAEALYKNFSVKLIEKPGRKRLLRNRIAPHPKAFGGTLA